MRKWIIILGVILIIVGLAWPILKNVGLGRLPGDIIFRKGNFTFYFPIVTSILISVLISIILWFINR